MSHPPDSPGRRRANRGAASSAAGSAYQGAFEAVMAVLVGAGAGYWVDRHWGTTPFGVIAGVVVGFAAMVLRLLRLGREVLPDAGAAPSAPGVGGVGADAETERGPAESPALSDVWRDDARGAEDRKTNGSSGQSE